jgi:preprotein translocase subunit SecD
MKKSRAAIALVLTVVIAGLLAFTALVGIGDGHRGSYHNIKLGLDLAGGASITYEAVGDEAPSDEDMSDTVYKLQQRVDQYSTEAQVYREGADRINIEIPGISGVEETNRILNELGQPGSLYFIRQTDESGNQNYELGTDAEGNTDYVLKKDLEQLKADGDVVLEGTDVQEAKAGYQNDDTGMLRAVAGLLNGYAADGIGVDENSLRYILWKQGRSDNGEILNIASDIAMRRRLGVGEFADPIRFSKAPTENLSDAAENVRSEYDTAIEEAKQNNQTYEIWMNHNLLQRGNPVKVFKGDL